MALVNCSGEHILITVKLFVVNLSGAYIITTTKLYVINFSGAHLEGRLIGITSIVGGIAFSSHFFVNFWLLPQFSVLPHFWLLGNCGAPETGIFLTLCHIFGSLRHNLSFCPAPPSNNIFTLCNTARLLSNWRE